MLSNKNSAIKGRVVMLQIFFFQIKLFLSIIRKKTFLVDILFAIKLIYNYLIT